jgi:hypothetical protein
MLRPVLIDLAPVLVGEAPARRNVCRLSELWLKTCTFINLQVVLVLVTLPMLNGLIRALVTLPMLGEVCS